ncbi:MAG TPA: hypothetical protein VJ417_14420, partial [Candidatus Glassbacteria bacterium]|nr:hypothetical protein [Candidatus Glassbacteria bacterium]
MDSHAVEQGVSPVESSREKDKLDALVRIGLEALKQGRPLSAVLSAGQIESLRHRYSHFRDETDTEGFVISSTHRVTRVSTPRPYLHLIGSNHSREYGSYGSFWDSSGAGFSCLDSVLAGPVTSHHDPSYVPTAPRATDHRHFYLREQPRAEDRPEIWHLFPQRGVEEERYEDFS